MWRHKEHSRQQETESWFPAILKGHRRLLASHRVKENWGRSLGLVGQWKDFSFYCENVENDWWISSREGSMSDLCLGKDLCASCGEYRLLWSQCWHRKNNWSISSGSLKRKSLRCFWRSQVRKATGGARMTSSVSPLSERVEWLLPDTQEIIWTRLRREKQAFELRHMNLRMLIGGKKWSGTHLHWHFVKVFLFLIDTFLSSFHCRRNRLIY